MVDLADSGEIAPGLRVEKRNVEVIKVKQVRKFWFNVSGECVDSKAYT